MINLGDFLRRTVKSFLENVLLGIKEIKILFEKKYKINIILDEILKKEVDIFLFLQSSERTFKKSPKKGKEDINFGEISHKKTKHIERKNKKDVKISSF